MDRRQKTVLLFLVSTFIMFMCPGETRASCCCPAYWTAYNGHCYRLFRDQKTWHQAEAICNQFSVPSLGRTDRRDSGLGHLVSIHSPDENDFVVTYFKTAGFTGQGAASPDRDLWIGCHDTTTEGVFKWTDRTPFNYTMWSSNEPNNVGSGRGLEEDCGEIKVSFGYKWNDDDCDQAVRYFMCKMPIW